MVLDPYRYDRNANTIDFAAHCGKIIHFLAEDIRPRLSSGSSVEEYRGTCRRLICLMDQLHVNLLAFVSNGEMRKLKPREQLIVQLVAASRLQEDICRAQQLGTQEGLEQATATQEALQAILNQVLADHRKMVLSDAITLWQSVNTGVYAGHPHAPIPEDH